MRAKVTRIVCVGAMIGAAVGVGASAASAGGTANFVGEWHVSEGVDFTIVSEDASGACTGIGVYPMTDCQVSGDAYTFTLSTGGYVSVNTGTITGDTLVGEFDDPAVHPYTAVRAATGPTITDLSVRSGPVKGGTRVVITGSGFGQAGDADQVNFVPVGGGSPVAAANPVVVSDSEIDVTTPDMTSQKQPDVALHTNVQVTTVNSQTSTISDAGKFNFPITLLEMGDSIASGEGTLYGYTYNTISTTWVGGNPNVAWAGNNQVCHDSPAAYGQLVANALGANFATVACTGATYVNGIMAPEVDGSTTYQPAQFGGAAYDAAEPDVVMATFGADDVQFVNIVKSCIATVELSFTGNETCTSANPGATVQTDFFGELQALRASYGAIAAAIENRGTNASPKRVPKVVFTDYMNPFPTLALGGCNDTWPLSNDQMAYMNVLMNDLNSTIKTAVSALMATDPNVGFADISNAIVGHTWCSADPWDYGLSVLTQGGNAGNLSFNGGSSPTSQAPFHPSPQGQAAIADIVAPVVSAMLNQPAATVASASSSADANGSSAGVTAPAGSQVTADATGYDAGETVVADAHSTAVRLGTTTADANGAVHLTVTLPADLAAGAHQLTLTGETSGVIATLPITVPAAPAPPVVSLQSPALTVAPGSVYQGFVGAAGNPTPTYALTAGSPSWLSISPSFTGEVAGTPPAGTSSFSYSVVAANGSGPAVTIGPFTVAVQAPASAGGGSSPTGVSVGSTAPIATVTRIAGTDRIGTSIAASVNGFPSAGSAKAVVLASSGGFADALAGTPLAVAKDGPLLLTGSATLDANTLTEIKRVLPAGGTVYVLGGTSSVSAAVVSVLTSAGFTVLRYGGTDRFDTSRIIASQGLGNPATVLLASGLNFPDGLAAGPAAASVKGAILLTDGASLDAGTSAYLSAHAADKVYAVGGAAAAADPAATALVGADRYATAALVATRFFPKATVAGLSTGLSFPDALSGGASIAELGGPMLLTSTSTLSSAVTGYLAANTAVSKVVVYGGTSAVSGSDLSAL